MTSFGKRLDGPGGRRSAPRAAVLLSAAMHAVGSSQPATLLDVSKTGARLRTRAPLHEGLHVWIKIPPADAFGTVMWIDGELCGVEFDEPFTDEEAAQLQSRPGHADAEPDLRGAIGGRGLEVGFRALSA